MNNPTAYDADHPAGRPTSDDDLHAVLDPDMYQAWQNSQDEDDE